jgi:hypothetical protein
MSANYSESNSVPASLIENLAKAHYQDREADRQLVRDLMVQINQIGTILVGMAAKMEEERAERYRRERHDERAARGVRS